MKTIDLHAYKFTSAIGRREFLKAFAFANGLALGGLALGGCSSWQPRGQESAMSSQAESEAKLQEGEQPAIDDGLLPIAAGTFLMGSPADEPWRGEDETLHEVSISEFYLAPTEVTQELYFPIMNENPSAVQDPSLPVESVTWRQAIAFCNAYSEQMGLTPCYAIDGEEVTWDRSADGYRLPTEAEWEYACRAGTTTPFNTETSISADTDANYYGTYPYMIEDNYFHQGNLDTQPGVYRQQPVAPASFPANRWGLYDMHGNVAEWVWDAYGPYPEEAVADPTGAPEGPTRVNRGGGWNDFAKFTRSAYRASLQPDNASPSIGFRLARNASALEGTAAAAGAASTGASGKGLVAFFSWSGNTRAIAQEISRQTGFDLFEIEPEDPYSSDYNTVLEEAQRDQNTQARPRLADRVQDMSQYGTVLLGYPNWWASIPMPIASFLEEYDFAGKRIVPFCSHGGGRLGQSVSAISKMAPDAIIGDALSIHYSGGSTRDSDIAAWLERNGIA